MIAASLFPFHGKKGPQDIPSQCDELFELHLSKYYNKLLKKAADNCKRIDIYAAVNSKHKANLTATSFESSVDEPIQKRFACLLPKLQGQLPSNLPIAIQNQQIYLKRLQFAHNINIHLQAYEHVAKDLMTQLEELLQRTDDHEQLKPLTSDLLYSRNIHAVAFNKLVNKLLAIFIDMGNTLKLQDIKEAERTKDHPPEELLSINSITEEVISNGPDLSVSLHSVIQDGINRQMQPLRAELAEVKSQLEANKSADHEVRPQLKRDFRGSDRGGQTQSMSREVSRVDEDNFKVVVNYPKHFAKRKKGSGPPEESLHEIDAPQSSVSIQQSAAKPVRGQDNSSFGRGRGGGFRSRDNPHGRSNSHWNAHKPNL